METVAVPVVWFWAMVGLMLGLLLGWFSGRQYQRRREEGMERPAIIADTQAKVEAELVKQYEAGVSQVQQLAAKIKALRS